MSPHVPIDYGHRHHPSDDPTKNFLILKVDPGSQWQRFEHLAMYSASNISVLSEVYNSYLEFMRESCLLMGVVLKRKFKTTPGPLTTDKKKKLNYALQTQ